MLFIFLIVATHISSSTAQSLPDVPADLIFAGVPIHMTALIRSRVQQEVRQLYTDRHQLERDIDALRQLTPLWQPYIINAGFPIDMRYAALPFATTESAAYWAVRPQQAAVMGLRMDASVDERMHPIIATKTVMANLKRMREVYKENPVQTLLRYLQTTATTDQPVQNSAQPVLLTVDSPPLIWKILARKIAVEQEEPTYRPSVSYLLYNYKNERGLRLPDIAQQLNLELERFTPYNQWLKTSSFPAGDDYTVLIRVKPDEFPRVKSAADVIFMSQSQVQDTGFPVLVKLAVQEQGLRAPAIYYTINEKRGIQAQPCDNAITLAFYGNITVNAFLMYNELTEQDAVRPGEIYYLERKAKRAKVPFHVVQRYQSIRDVSNMYGVRLSSVLHYNGISPTQRVRVGRVLWLRKKRPRRIPVEYQQLPAEEPIPIPEPAVSTIDTSAQLPVAASESPRPVAADSTLILTTTAPNVSEKPVPVANPPATKPVKVGKLHIVKPGQTYYAISRLYSITLKQLYAWNGLSEQIPLEVGQELVVGKKPLTPTRAAISPSKPASEGLVNSYVVEQDGNEVRYHVVQPGQTVYRVALINKVSVADVMRWNNLKNYSIEVGQRLIIRKPK